jgi:tripartite-type tricarboxylate transporter receptor subunit TctC
MPALIVTRLHRELAAILQERDVIDTFNRQGVEISVGTPDELGALIRAEVAKWRGVIKSNRIGGL